MRYHTPTSFADAATIAAGTTGTLRFLAGWTDVLVQMRAGMVQPDDLIDLKHIPGVDQVTQTPEGGWRIGVAVPGIVLGAHEAFVRDWPGVVEGMNLVGSTQVQGRATLAGNLCNGSPAADSVPGMVAAGAVVTVTIKGASGDISSDKLTMPDNGVASVMLSTVPVGRFAEAGEIGGVIAFLCTNAAAYVNGQSLAVDGGRMQSI